MPIRTEYQLARKEVGTTYMIKAACTYEEAYHEFVERCFDNKEEADMFANTMDIVLRKMHNGPIDPNKPFYTAFTLDERLCMSYVRCGTYYIENDKKQFCWVEEVKHIITTKVTFHYYPFDLTKGSDDKVRNPHLFSKLHRTDGPAIEFDDERFKDKYPYVYYLYGVPYNRKDYYDAIFALGYT